MQVPPSAPLQTIQRDDGATIAYHRTPGKSPGKPVGVMFLGGSHSNMDGSKALALEKWCQDEGRAFLRFDYFGHGQSSGAFTDGVIGRWAEDAVFALDHLTEGPQVLVGSSMGGWISMLVARERPERLRGLIGLASAPDFTEDLMWQELSDDHRAEMARDGQVTLPNDYDPQQPYIITQRLIEDGKNHLLLRDPLNLKMPVRLIHGLKDPDVPWQTALKIQDVLVSDDVEVQLVKNGDHRLSQASDLTRMIRTLAYFLNDLENDESESA